MMVLAPGPVPAPITLDGRYGRLEPLTGAHAPALYAAVAGEGMEARYRYLPYHPPRDLASMQALIADLNARPHGLFSAVIDRETGLCGGHQGLIAIRPPDRVVEIGSVLYGRGVSRTRIGTEAFFLAAIHVFETLLYRRLEWKCDARNLPSAAAARRFGFTYEGSFRQHMIVKGENRDTAWFSMLDGEWPGLKPIYEAWLDPMNFDGAGRAKTLLGTMR